MRKFLSLFAVGVFTAGMAYGDEVDAILKTTMQRGDAVGAAFRGFYECVLRHSRTPDYQGVLAVWMPNGDCVGEAYLLREQCLKEKRPLHNPRVRDQKDCEVIAIQTALHADNEGKRSK